MTNKPVESSYNVELGALVELDDFTSLLTFKVEDENNTEMSGSVELRGTSLKVYTIALDGGLGDVHLPKEEQVKVAQAIKKAYQQYGLD